MARTLPRKFRIPIVLDEILEVRAKEAGYDNASEYLLGLYRYDLLTRKPHVATTRISDLPRAEQDKIDDELARAFHSGESLGGSYFQHHLEEAVKDLETGSEHKVVDKLLGRISKKPKAKDSGPAKVVPKE